MDKLPAKPLRAVLNRAGIIAIISSFMLPYFIDRPWKFFLGSALLLIFSRLTFGKQWLVKIGIPTSRKSIALSSVLLIIVFFVSRQLVPYLLSQANMEFDWYGEWNWRISPFFQALNEEIVLRALLLTTLVRLFKSKLAITFGAAFLFSALHWIFYHYNQNGAVNLTPLALSNLFLFALICNWFFFRYRHIGFGLALHAGWNLTRFAGDYMFGKTYVKEGVTFNQIEGSIWLTALLGIVFALVTAFMSEPLSSNSGQVQKVT